MAKVLLAEDDNNLREIYEARLQAEGYETVVARDGEEALVMAKKELPDLLISDVMMPKISGFEMLDILRNTDGIKNIKVIMLTALGQSEDQTRANSLGADRYLVKSQVTLEDIVNAAADLLSPDGGAASVAAAAPAAAAAVEPSLAPAPSEVAAADHMAEGAVVEPVMPPHTVADLPDMPVVEPPAEVADAAVALQMPPTPATTIPDVAAESTPEPAAEPVATPSVTEEAPVAVQEAAAPAEAATVAAQAPTQDAEKAAIANQVIDFLKSQPGTAPAPAPTPTMPPSGVKDMDFTVPTPAPATPAAPTDNKGDFDPDSVAL